MTIAIHQIEAQVKHVTKKDNMYRWVREANKWLEVARQPECEIETKNEIIGLFANIVRRWAYIGIPSFGTRQMESIFSDFNGIPKFHYEYGNALFERGCKKLDEYTKNKDQGTLQAGLTHIISAIGQFETATRLNENYVAAYRKLMRAYLIVEHYDEKYHGKAESIIEKRQSDNLLVCDFASILAKTGKIDRAESVLTSLIGRNPDYDHAKAVLGGIYKDAGRYDEAIETIKGIQNPSSLSQQASVIYREIAELQAAEKREAKKHGDPKASGVWASSSLLKPVNEAASRGTGVSGVKRRNELFKPQCSSETPAPKHR